jgi:hypothetical protein
MKKSDVVAILLFTFVGVGTTTANEQCSQQKSFADFLSYGSGTKEFTESEVKSTFGPMVGCLKRWVEDGGTEDGLPLQDWAKAFPERVVYRAKAMELIDALVLLDVMPAKENVGPWIRSSVEGWPEPVKWNAWKTLADLHDRDAIPLLRLEAARAEGIGRTFAWEQLARLSPETAVSDLENYARSNEDYKALGFALLSSDSPSVIPMLRRLMQLDPGKSGRYSSRIEELERSRK